MNKNKKLKPFNIYWCLYVLVMIILIIVIAILGNKLDLKGKYALLLGLDIFLYVSLRVYKFSLKLCPGFEYNYFNELVCYLCSQSCLLCLLGTIFKNVSMMAYCTTVGMASAFMAVLMPEEYFENSKPLSIAALGFFGWHCLLIVACISFITLHIYTPELKDFIYGPLWTLCLAFISHLVNIFLRKTKIHPEANYTYTYFPENIILKKLYEKIPIPFVYLLPLIPAYALVSFVMIVIYRLFI